MTSPSATATTATAAAASAVSGTRRSFKKNEKLETFLRKILEVDSFEKLRCYETAIVDGAGENKALKYVALTDALVYSIDNPTPRNPRLLADLRRASGIQLVRHLPDFLDEHVAKTVQHIQITFVDDGRPDDSSKSPRLRRISTSDFKSSPRNSVSGVVAFLPSALHNRLLFEELGGGGGGGLRRSSSSEVSLRTPRRAFSDETDVIVGQTARRVKPTSRSKIEADSTDSSSGVESESSSSGNSVGRHLPANDRPLTSSLPTDDLRRLSLIYGGREKVDDGKKTTTTTTTTRRSVVFVEEGDKPPSGRRLPLPPTPRDLPSPRLSLSGVENNNNNNNNNNGRRSLGAAGVKPARILSFDAGRRRTSSIGDDDDAGFESGGVVSGGGAPSDRTLDLYILNKDSPMISFMWSVWSNIHLKGTLALDEPLASRPTKGSRDAAKTESLFAQLVREILTLASRQTDESIEQVYRLLQELRLGASRNFALKKLFWRRTNLAEFLVGKMEEIFAAPTPSNGTSAAPNRLDALELGVAVASTLGEMLDDTELMPERLEFFRADDWRFLRRLLTALTLCGVVDDDDDDDDLQSLAAESTLAAAALLFRLCEMAKYDADALNLRLLLDLLGAQQGAAAFFKAMLRRMFSRILEDREMSPEEAVDLFRRLSIVRVTLQHDKNLARLIRRDFAEEFKYYAQPLRVEPLLPRRFPVAAPTMALLKTVVADVAGDRAGGEAVT